jgi:hypothetical protein
MQNICTNYIFMYNITELAKNILKNMPIDLIIIVLKYYLEEMHVQIVRYSNNIIRLYYDNYELYVEIRNGKIVDFYTHTSNKIKSYGLLRRSYKENIVRIEWRCINLFLSKYNKHFFPEGQSDDIWYARDNCFHGPLKSSFDTIICEYKDQIKCDYTNIFLEPLTFLLALDLFRETLFVLGYDVICDDKKKIQVIKISGFLLILA